MLAAIGILLGIVLGYAAGGRLDRIPDLDNTLVIMLVALSLVQGLARGRLFGLNPTSVGLAVWAAVSFAFCVAAFWRSARYAISPIVVRGLALVALGTFANVLVVLLNQGMPVPDAPGAAEAILSSGGFYIHLNAGTVLPWLGDVLLVGLGGVEYLVSLGDVSLIVGTTVLMLDLMLSSDAASHTTAAPSIPGQIL